VQLKHVKENEPASRGPVDFVATAASLPHQLVLHIVQLANRRTDNQVNGKWRVVNGKRQMATMLPTTRMSFVCMSFKFKGMRRRAIWGWG